MALGRWQKLSEETILHTRWNDYKHDRFRTAEGHEGDYYYVYSKHVAMVVPVTAEGRIMMIRQYRYLFDKESLEFPCGGARVSIGSESVDDDSPEVTARRELAEEAGMEGELTLTGKDAPWNGVATELQYTYLATGLRPVKAGKDDTEEFERITLTPEEIDRKISEGEIWDGMSINAWVHSKPYLQKYL